MTTGNGDPGRPAASIVIRCYNESDHIGGVLDALATQSFADFEIIAVDSGSDDGTLDILESSDANVLRIPKETFSFGRSLNLGCSAARGDLLVFLSAHCYPADEKWLENLLGGFQDPTVAAVYGRQRGVDSSPFSERQILKRWFPDTTDERQDGPFLNNANCAIRRSTWEEYPYDEELPGLEDVAWAKDVCAAGWNLSYRADATVLHVHDETRSQTRNRYQREAITFQKVFPNEHFNLLDFLRLSARNIGADWNAARAQGVLLRNSVPIVTFRLAQFWGTYRGFHTRWPSSSDLKRRFYYPDE
jgi:glycosyltransferase involved in cell wall biosynthesis